MSEAEPFMRSKKLFAAYLGGRSGDCHIEMHDIRFVVGETLDDTIGTLLKEWVGDRKSAHLDAYVELKEVEGFKISLVEKPAPNAQKLYFVNLGGYDPNKFTELHEVGFFVAKHGDEAKKKAKNLLLQDATQRHKDDLFDVDDCVALETVAGLHVQLTPGPGKKAWEPLKPDWVGYRVIRK